MHSIHVPRHAGAGLAVIGLLFEYIALLRAAGPQRWAYDEMAAIGNMKFRFAEEEVGASVKVELDPA